MITSTTPTQSALLPMCDRWWYEHSCFAKRDFCFGGQVAGGQVAGGKSDGDVSMADKVYRL